MSVGKIIIAAVGEQVDPKSFRIQRHGGIQGVSHSSKFFIVNHVKLCGNVVSLGIPDASDGGRMFGGKTHKLTKDGSHLPLWDLLGIAELGVQNVTRRSPYAGTVNHLGGDGDTGKKFDGGEFGVGPGHVVV